MDDIRAEHVDRRVPCRVRAVTAALEGQERADLLEAVADPRVQGAAIARALTKRGLKIAQSSIQRHRRGDCRRDTR